MVAAADHLEALVHGTVDRGNPLPLARRSLDNMCGPLRFVCCQDFAGGWTSCGFGATWTKASGCEIGASA